MPPESASQAPEWASAVSAWRQGDYSLDHPYIVVVNGLEEGQFAPSAGDALGLVVVSQTCDVVNYGPGKDYVTVSPLVESTEERVKNARRGSSPSLAVLENPPSGSAAVDLGQTMSLHKSVLAGLERREGFDTDEARSRFGDAVARKYGRFAFPDAFSVEVLEPLRRKLQRGYGKDSDQSRAYGCIDSIRAVASPSWDGPCTVGFRFVLADRERLVVGREVVDQHVAALVAAIKWPEGFTAESPAYTLMTRSEMSAAEWDDSQKVDLDFISFSEQG